MLIDIKHCLKNGATFKCDEHTSYITNIIPTAQLEQLSQGKKKAVKRDDVKKFEQLFSINDTFATMRCYMNRLGRKTWLNTKAIHELEKSYMALYYLE